jgi:hypothetical protein
MLLEHDGDKLRAFRLYRDSDVYTLGGRIGSLGQELRVDWTLSLTLVGVLTELKM